MAKRLAGMGVSGYEKEAPFKVVCHPDRLDEPLRVKKPSRIGVSFMGDLFHKDVPRDFIDAVWSTFAEARKHTFLVLTKRPARMLEFMKDRSRKGWKADWQNIHLGVSVEDQATADERIPLLLQTPAGKRFVSIEPMLGPINLDRVAIPRGLVECNGGQLPGLDQVILGGETGPGARPMHPDWARKVRDQCKAAGVPFFFKQWGEWAPVSKWCHHNWNANPKKSAFIDINGYDFMKNKIPPSIDMAKTVYEMKRVGKKAAGHLLDGEEHREVVE